MLSISQRNTIAEILEIPDNGRPDIELARKNYKRLLKLYHPDINKTKEAEEFCKKLNWAMGVLTGKIKIQQAPPPPPPRQPRVVIIVTNGFNVYSQDVSGTNSWSSGTRRTGW